MRSTTGTDATQARTRLIPFESYAEMMDRVLVELVKALPTDAAVTLIGKYRLDPERTAERFMHIQIAAFHGNLSMAKTIIDSP